MLENVSRILLLVGRPGLEPGDAKQPVLQTGPLPATVYRPIFIMRKLGSPVGWPGNRKLNKICWPSPYTSNNLQSYSISEETQSELRGATPNFWPQRVSTSYTIPGKPVLLQSHAGLITYNFHPPFRTNNFYYHQIAIFFVMSLRLGYSHPDLIL